MTAQPPTRPLVAALLRGELERVRPLLAEGVDPNAAWLDGDRETPLMVAAGSGFEEAVGWLLAAGADPSIRDAQGRTACIWAAEVQNTKLAERLWQAQTGRPAGDLRASDLSPTRLDEVETPLTRAQDYLVLRAVSSRYTEDGRFLALASVGIRADAQQAISADNNRAVDTGPYLLCRRLSLPQEARARPTNPLARSRPVERIPQSQLLVLCHLPTTTTDPGRSLSQQHDPHFRGYATISDLFAPEAEDKARAAALAEPGRVSLVQQEEVCTCYEGWLEHYETLVKTAEAWQASGKKET